MLENIYLCSRVGVSLLPSSLQVCVILQLMSPVYCIMSNLRMGSFKAILISINAFLLKSLSVLSTEMVENIDVLC